MVLEFKKNSPCRPYCICPCRGDDFPECFEIDISSFVTIGGGCSECDLVEGTYNITRDEDLCEGTIILGDTVCGNTVTIKVWYSDNATEICEYDYDINLTITFAGGSPTGSKTYVKNITDPAMCTGTTENPNIHTMGLVTDLFTDCTSGTITVEGKVESECPP